MSIHTPGPWAWAFIEFGSSFMEEEGAGLIIYPEALGSGFAALMTQSIIAAPHIHFSEADDGSESDDRQEAEANEQLMAASPTMLAALVELVGASSKIFSDPVIRAAVDQGRRAIAEATGIPN